MGFSFYEQNLLTSCSSKKMQMSFYLCASMNSLMCSSWNMANVSRVSSVSVENKHQYIYLIYLGVKEK